MFSPRRQTEAPPQKPNGGCSERRELQATPLCFNGADGICIDPVNKKRHRTEGGPFKPCRGDMWGLWREAKPATKCEIRRRLSRFHINAKCRKSSGERLSDTTLSREPKLPSKSPRISLTVEWRGKTQPRLLVSAHGRQQTFQNGSEDTPGVGQHACAIQGLRSNLQH